MLLEQIVTDNIVAAATVINCLAFIGSIWFVYGQLKHARRQLEQAREALEQARLSTMASAFAKAVDIIQDELKRTDRGTIFSIQDKKYSDWTEVEREAGERVCHSYDQVGIMIRAGMFPKELIVDSWGYSLRRIWPILKPLVIDYRTKKDSDEFWDDFQWLAEEAQAFAVERKKRAAQVRANK